MLVNVSPGFLSVTLYEFLVLISVRNRLLTENYRGRVTDGLTIRQTCNFIYKDIQFCDPV